MLKKPNNPCFSSGPTAKRPGWSPQNLKQQCIGRSHRSKLALQQINEIANLTRCLLDIPEDYHLALMPASSTGAIEAALWNLLGPKPVDILVWDVFGRLWLHDIMKELRLEHVHILEASPGDLPSLTNVNEDHDIVFTWTGTTTGVSIPNLDWISSNRKGLVISDLASAAFATEIDWNKLDAAAFSWQKGLGGEGAHGVLVLSPRAISRMESYKPSWPIPRLFRLTNNGKLISQIFSGHTINTPSMLCLADALDALNWCHKIGGLPALVTRSKANLASITDWVAKRDWVDFLASNPSSRASTAVCLKLLGFNEEEQWQKITKMTALLEAENVAFDIAGHSHSFPCIRIWCGPTVELEDIKRLLPWIDWAYEKVRD